MKRIHRFALMAAAGWLLAGCGGGGSQSLTGRATFTVIWPPPSRLIPLAANSITVTIFRNGNQVASQVLARPPGGGSASATFNPLPVASLTATATAFPNTDGSGVAQATATVPLTVSAGQSTAFTVTMASTIDHLELSPASPSVPVTQTLALAVTAKDISNNIVLMAPSKLTWGSANTNKATVDANGVVTGVAPTGVNPGPVQVTVTDTESGKSVSAAVAVTSSTTVAVNPPSPTMSVLDPLTFTAVVNNAPDTTVTWTVVEAGGGTITAAGVYTAPATAGTYHVTATSNYDNSKSNTVPVTVQSGNANVTIN